MHERIRYGPPVELAQPRSVGRHVLKPMEDARNQDGVLIEDDGSERWQAFTEAVVLDGPERASDTRRIG